MNSKKILTLASVIVLMGTGVQAQLKYLDCGIDFSCPYFSG